MRSNVIERSGRTKGDVILEEACDRICLVEVNECSTRRWVHEFGERVGS